MKTSAAVVNQFGTHQVTLETDGQVHSLEIAPKAGGYGSSANGGELLFLALATCYCNDIYREAARQGIQISRVDVRVEGEFDGPGDPARNITYHARVAARASAAAIKALMEATDAVAEIQNTLRAATPVRLAEIEAVPV